MPIIPYSYNTIIRDLSAPAPSPPSNKNWLGTDDQARDVSIKINLWFSNICIIWIYFNIFFNDYRSICWSNTRLFWWKN